MKLGLSVLLTIFTATYRHVTASFRPELIFHFITPGVDERLQILDIAMEAKIDHLFARVICRSPGNKLTIRIGPKDGTTDLIDDKMSLHNDSAGAVSCLNPLLDNPVTCTETNFCTLHSNCVASLLAPCPRQSISAPWKSMQYVDVTVSQSGGDLVVSRCFAFCETHAEMDEDESQRISATVVGLVVGGSIVAASLLVLSFIVWSFKKHRNVPQN
ncbi:uncharacterized protein LOC129921819 [Biomphalaria glabrata]|uniref:Uncharacterized protein LOC129921819 n=1 Tax=Biomphalaria glabrata TaxID=6526 RepID=A0A9W2YE02_BIOGL|nr:uncharacterized protein LOC129921819 [Biomphalaria glabrata]XP_055860850.1 uncharacterized protein LOC129921819 [Biomphalaria glabrata]